MKKNMTRFPVRHGTGFVAEQKLSVPMTLSFIGHLLFCLLFVLLPKFSFESNIPAHYINVQLITASAPLPASAPDSPAPASVSEAPPAETPAPAEAESLAPKAQAATGQSKEAVSLAPRDPEKKQSMKKRTYKREQVMESAIKNVEKRVVSSQTDQKQQALDRIRAEVAAQEARTSAESSGDEATATAGLGGQGRTTSDIQRIYYAEVAFHIQKNWAFSDQMAGGEKNLYNEVVIKIVRSGSIEDVWFDRRSGNSYFDDSTYKAILKSSPLPQIPDDISGGSLTLGFRFIPEGLK